MKYYAISYYRNRYWLDKRYVKTEYGASVAIRKSRISRPVEVVEITEAEYQAYTAKKREAAAARKERFII